MCIHHDSTFNTVFANIKQLTLKVIAKIKGNF